MELLDGHAQSADIRDALIYAVEHDQNAAVRAKAIEGLAPYASEPEVRGALAKVLLADSNAGLRTEAIDLLTRGVTLDPQTVGTLQELLVRGEQPGYVRERCQSALRAVKASLETY
jgi:HEAT repeat protein